MTVKEAILKSLEELNKLTNYNEIYDHIVKNNYYDFGKSKTPALTIFRTINFIHSKRR